MNILFKEDGVYIPDKNQVLRLANAKKMEKALRQINSMNPSESSCRSLFVTSQTWIKEAITSCYPAACEVDVICDILFLADDGEASLTSIVGGAKTEAEYKSYARLACRYLKQELLITCEEMETRSVASDINIYITPYVYNIDTECISNIAASDNKDLNSFITVCTAYRSGDIEVIAKGLLTLLMRHTDLLHDPATLSRIHELPQITLTQEQILSILEMEAKPCAFTMITGPPGSGKATMAMYLCRYFAEQPYQLNVLYVTSCRSAESQIINQERCRTALIRQEQDVAVLCNTIREAFGCVIIDDVHNMPVSESWKRIFLTLRDMDQECFTFLFDDSHFQVCHQEQRPQEQRNSSLSNAYTSFKQSSNLTHTDITLKDVHRNSVAITSYITINLSSTDNKHINPMSRAAGDAVSIFHAPDIMETGPGNPLVRHLTDILEGDLSRKALLRRCNLYNNS